MTNSQAEGLSRRLREHVSFLAASPRHRDVPGSMERARDYCIKQLAAGGWSTHRLPFTARPAVRMSDAGKPGPLLMRPFGALEGVNLVAGDTSGVLVVAHLDTVRKSPGADDNASAVAVLLECARALSGAQGVGFAVTDFEELQVLGARHLVRQLGDRPPRSVLCLDSVGYFDDEPGSQRIPAGFGIAFPQAAAAIRGAERRGDFLLAICRETSSGLTRRWEESSQAQGLRSVVVQDPRWAGRGQRFTRWINPLLMDFDRSDHAPFWRAGVPAVWVTDTAPLRNRLYHRAEDTADTLDYSRLAALVHALVQTMRAEAASQSSS